MSGEGPFTQYAANGFKDWLLPILPPGARVRNPDLADKRGKIPGVYLSYADAWSGMGGWAKRGATTDSEVATWETWPGAGVGLRTGRLVAIDVDVDDDETVARVREQVKAVYGWREAPVRWRDNSPRVLFLLRLAENEAPLKKMRIPLDGGGVVEILGHGQQFVAEGTHPSGAAYRWRNRKAAAGLPICTAAQLESFVASLPAANDAEARVRYAGEAVRQEDLQGDAEAVRTALRTIPNDLDYDAWIALSMAVKAAAGERVYDDWVDWSLQWPENTPEGLQAKWDSFQPPFRTGAQYVFEQAAKYGGDAGRVVGAAAEFGEVAEWDATRPAAEPELPIGLERLFRRYFYVSEISRFMAYDDPHTFLDDVQLSKKHIEVGDYKSRTEAAAYQYLSNAGHRDFYDRLDYLPGEGPVIEKGGKRIRNRWTPSGLKLPAKGSVTDDDVRPWLDHCAWLFPVEWERRVMIDWARCLVQRPAEKINWAPLIRGGEGTGKDTFLIAVRAAVGEQNVRELDTSQLASNFNGWADGVKLLIGTEIHTFTRVETNDKLKPIIARTATGRLTINRKNMEPYEVENVICFVAMSNHLAPVPIGPTDRRWFVPETPERHHPDGEDYYDRLYGWYENGGLEKVARWLWDTAISAEFKPQGRAPETKTKEQMRNAGRGPLEAWAADCIEEGASPFAGDLVALQLVKRNVPGWVLGGKAGGGVGGGAGLGGSGGGGGSARVSERRLAEALHSLGAEKVGGAPIRLNAPLWDGGPERVHLWAVRNVERWRDASADDLRAAFMAPVDADKLSDNVVKFEPKGPATSLF